MINQNDPNWLVEQQRVLAMKNAGKSITEIANILGMSHSATKRRLNAALKRERLDPEILRRLDDKGLTDLTSLHSGWLIEKDKNGSGQSLYFYLGPDEEKISFVDALMDVLQDIPKLDPIPLVRPGSDGEDYANWLALADLHIGGDYGNPETEQAFNDAIDDLVTRMPPAEHATFFELGDLLEANDHKGVTPKSGNLLDVKNEDSLRNAMTAVRLIRRAIYRLLETHQTVDAHFIKGNHDPTAYFAVMMSLAEHFSNNPRVTLPVNDNEFRVISWGECAAFPHHGDTLNWNELKDVFADQFPDEWAAAKTHRHIMTAHFHHDRKRDLVGATAEQYQTIHRPNNWAKSKGMFSRGSLTAMTVHKRFGEEYRTISNIRPKRGG